MPPYLSDALQAGAADGILQLIVDQPPRPNRRLTSSAAFTIVLAAAVGLSGCDGVLDPKGPIALAERSILLNAMVIMLAIIVPTMIATIGFAWWYRAGNEKATYRPTFAYSGRVELVVWSIPLLTIIFLSGIAWIGSHQLDPAVPIASEKKALEVQVVSLDWKWLFIYPEQHVAALNQIVVPAGTPVHFSLTSSSVWNSFFVPQLGSQIYTMRGMTTQLNLLADKEGSFFGLSTHFSGDGFSDMKFDLRAVSDKAFDDWIKAAQGSGAALDEAAYTALAKQSTADAPKTFNTVDPDLFGKVVSAKLAIGPGPSQGASPNVTPKGGS